MTIIWAAGLAPGSGLAAGAESVRVRPEAEAEPLAGARIVGRVPGRRSAMQQGVRAGGTKRAGCRCDREAPDGGDRDRRGDWE